MKNIFLVLFLFSICVHAQINPLVTSDKYFQKKWTDSIMNNMSIDQKIGQLFMLAAYSNKDKKHTDYLESIIKKYQIGGLIFMQGTPEAQIKLNNRYQNLANVPLLIGFDGEWGLDMRLKNTYKYPWNMTLGAIRNDSLIKKFGEQLGEQCKRVGIHINFAPVVDINTNPKNPIIGNRSFGENKFNVTQKAIAFTNGLQSKQVLACAKHFPGHGDTASDSHKTLPTVKFSAERIDSVELYPYKQLFKNGIGSIMAAHLSIPSLESDSKTPTSLSYHVITELLKKKMNYKGLIFTDALNMKGVSEFVDKPTKNFLKSGLSNKGRVDLKAFLAGNDVLLFSENVGQAIKHIKYALETKQVTLERINESVRKILNAKYWCGLQNYKSIKLENVQQDLHKVENSVLHYDLMENAITLLKNDKAIFPIRDLVKEKVAYVKLGDSDYQTFYNRLQDYDDVSFLNATSSTLLKDLKNYSKVIIGYHKSNANPWKSYAFSKAERVLIQKIAKQNKVILTVFASPYSLLDITNFKNIDAVLLAYQNSNISQDLAAQMIFGALSTKGKLPVNIGEHFKEGFGLRSANLFRLSFGLPEQVGVSGKLLKHIDTITKRVLDLKMAPGMQILVAKKGKVIYRKNIGYYTNDKLKKVENNSIYDLASLTKMLGALPFIMKAEEEHKFNIGDRLDALFPILKGSNKDTVTVKEALAHVGRLRPWIPFYLETIDKKTKQPLAKYYSKEKTFSNGIQVAKNLFLRNDYKDTIYQKIAEAPQRIHPGYKYSGFAFYLFKDYIEKKYNKPLDKLDDTYFYKPLGANTLMYNPLRKFKKEQIVPTEKDTYFRHQLLQGYVHDMGAAMLGGVNGNAGLFGNSLDVAKMMQMYLQKGYYGGKRFLKPKTIDKFNTQYYKNKGVRRGLGFDKPQINPEELATCGCVSMESFGHSGFTGTYAWADPKTELIYIFLSNRVYPTMANRGLVKEDIRIKIQQVIQDAIVE